MMEIRFVLLLFLAGAATAQDPDYAQCLTDSDCPRRFFCASKMGNSICDRCVDCAGDFFRLSSGMTDCAKSGEECGTCLPGFEAEALTQGKVRKRCRKIEEGDDITTPRADDGVEDTSVLVMVGVVVGVAFGVIAMAGAMFGVVVCCTKLARKTRAAVEDAEAPIVATGGAAASENDGESEDDQLLLQQHQPPSYEQSQRQVEEADPLLPPAAVRDDGSGPGGSSGRRRSREESETLSICVEESSQAKSEATPFNLPGYSRHLPVAPDDDDDDSPLVNEGALQFEGEFELQLITVDRSQSPTESVHSNATEPSQWQPEDQEPFPASNLADINEESESDAASDHQDLPDNQDYEDDADEQVVPLTDVQQQQQQQQPPSLPPSPLTSSRQPHPLASDSGFLTTTASLVTLDDAPGPFSFSDSGMNLAEINQDTVRSLDELQLQQSGSSPMFGSRLFRSYSSVDMPFAHVDDEEEEEEGLRHPLIVDSTTTMTTGCDDNTSSRIEMSSSSSRKRRSVRPEEEQEREEEEEHLSAKHLRYKVNRPPPRQECNSEESE